jgi:hypothetical protein
MVFHMANENPGKIMYRCKANMKMKPVFLFSLFFIHLLIFIFNSLFHSSYPASFFSFFLSFLSFLVLFTHFYLFSFLSVFVLLYFAFLLSFCLLIRHSTNIRRIFVAYLSFHYANMSLPFFLAISVDSTIRLMHSIIT